MKKKEILPTVEWYVEPIGSHTNKVVADFLTSKEELVVGSHANLKDNKKKEHSVYRMPDYFSITALYKSKVTLGLTFNVFSRFKNYGPIRLWIFGEKKKSKKS